MTERNVTVVLTEKEADALWLAADMSRDDILDGATSSWTEPRRRAYLNAMHKLAAESVRGR